MTVTCPERHKSQLLVKVNCLINRCHARQISVARAPCCPVGTRSNPICPPRSPSACSSSCICFSMIAWVRVCRACVVVVSAGNRALVRLVSVRDGWRRASWADSTSIDSPHNSVCFAPRGPCYLTQWSSRPPALFFSHPDAGVTLMMRMKVTVERASCRRSQQSSECL